MGDKRGSLQPQGASSRIVWAQLGTLGCFGSAKAWVEMPLLRSTGSFSLLFPGHLRLLKPLYPVRDTRLFNWFLVVMPLRRCFTAPLSICGMWGSLGELPMVCWGLEVLHGAMLWLQPNLAPALPRCRQAQG